MPDPKRHPNLHNPLNLEHKSLQDVYLATQSEPIRACYRPAEIALFKTTRKRTWGGTRDKEETEKEKVGVCGVYDNYKLLRVENFYKTKTFTVLISFEAEAFECLHTTVAHNICACSARWAGSAGNHGIDFMNNRSRLPPEGSAKAEHLYGIKALERTKESLKVGGEGKGGFLALDSHWCFGKNNNTGPLNQ